MHFGRDKLPYDDEFAKFYVEQHHKGLRDHMPGFTQGQLAPLLLIILGVLVLSALVEIFR